MPITVTIKHVFMIHEQMLTELLSPTDIVQAAAMSVELNNSVKQHAAAHLKIQIALPFHNLKTSNIYI